MNQRNPLAASSAAVTLNTACETLLLLALVLPLVWPYDPGPSAKAVSMLLAAGLWSATALLAAAAGWVPRLGLASGGLAALAAVVVAQTLGGRLAYASTGWDSALLLAGSAALAGLGQRLARRRDWMDLVCGALLFQGLAQVAIGLLQFGMWQLPAAAQGLSDHADWVYQLISYPGDGRIYGNLRQPNHYASALALGLAGLAGLAPRLRPRQIWLAALALCWGLMASGSRSAALQALLVAGAVLLVVPRSWKSPQWRPLLAVPLLYAACLLLQHGAESAGWISGLDAVSRTLDQPVNARSIIWRNAWQAFALQPLGGWGWGQIGWALERSAATGSLHPLPLENIDNAHDLILQLLTDTGIGGAAVVLLFLLGWGWKLAQPWRASAAATQRRLALLAPALAAGCLLLHSLLEYPLWYVYFLFIFAFCLGWAEGAAAADPAMPPTAAGGRARQLGLLLALAALLLCGKAAYDYQRTSQVFESDSQGAARALQQDWFFAPLADFALASAIAPEPADTTAQLETKLTALERASHAWGDPGLLERRMLVLLRLGRPAQALQLADYCAHAFWLYAPQTRKELAALAAKSGQAADPNLARIQDILAHAPTLKRISVRRQPGDDDQE